jgi:DNA-3-methyladenine glycosylase I
MSKPSYCQYCRTLESTSIHKIYHDTEYGKRVICDNELFERLTLEIFQAGLSWDIILKKRSHFQEAFSKFQIIQVAQFNQEHIEKLMLNKAIVRNRKKIEATIYNARKMMQLKSENGSFYSWLEDNRLKTLSEWTILLKKNFKFVGTEIVNEFLKGANLLKGAHDEDCYLNN